MVIIVFLLDIQSKGNAGAADAPARRHRQQRWGQADKVTTAMREFSSMTVSSDTISLISSSVNVKQ
jgi:hypothetical protein